MSVLEEIWRFIDIEHNWVSLLLVAVIAIGMVMTYRVSKGTLGSMTKPEHVSAAQAVSVSWDEIKGCDAAKDELIEVVDFLKHPERFARLGARAPQGVLLHGPPGTGKTMLAKAVASQAGVDFFAASGSSFVEMFVGRGAARIRALFKEARKAPRAVIFIDELDAVGGKRGQGANDSSEREQALNQLLVEMDGFEADNIVVIAASNLIDKLDPALLRPGRFDRQVLVPAPDKAGRAAILEVHTNDKPLAGDVDLETIAVQTTGMTGASLANLANEAAIVAGRDGRRRILQYDFEQALERVLVGTATSKRLNDTEREIVAYHEAGHALVNEMKRPLTEPTHRVSIIPRGPALGYHLRLPDEESHLQRREELMARLAVLAAGRAAEKAVFGSVTGGAADDLKQIEALSRAMVTDYGFGTKLEGTRFGVDVREGVGLSEETRREIDLAARSYANNARLEAERIIKEGRDLLDEIAGLLLKNEVIEREELEEIVGSEKPPAALVELFNRPRPGSGWVVHTGGLPPAEERGVLGA